jgi:hypothetical protein
MLQRGMLQPGRLLRHLGARRLHVVHALRALEGMSAAELVKSFPST